MKVTMAWFGGSSYASPEGKDVEHFSSLKTAKEVFQSRETDFDPYYPCVEGSSAMIWFGHLDDTTDIYPELELTLGPKGGVRVNRC